MRVADVMTRGVKTAEPGERAEAAWNRMRSFGIHHLVVVDDTGVVGVLSERDLGGRNGAAVRAAKTVADLMTPGVVAAAPDDSIRRVANRMRGRSIGCVPVMEGRKLRGILTVSDILDLVGRGTERPVGRSKRWTLKHRGPRRA